jgi:Cu+-exporting ATPase
VNAQTGKETAMAKDPVCGMTVDEKKAAATASYQGKTYYFCSAACKATFDKAPATYAEARE